MPWGPNALVPSEGSFFHTGPVFLPFNMPKTPGIEMQLLWRKDFGNATVGHMIFAGPEHNSIVDWPEALQRRVACYALVDAMPESGLEEAQTTLFDCWEHYSSMKPLQPVLAEKTEINLEHIRFPTSEPLYVSED